MLVSPQLSLLYAGSFSDPFCITFTKIYGFLSHVFICNLVMLFCYMVIHAILALWYLYMVVMLKMSLWSFFIAFMVFFGQNVWIAELLQLCNQHILPKKNSLQNAGIPPGNSPDITPGKCPGNTHISGAIIGVNTGGVSGGVFGGDTGANTGGGYRG